MTVIVCPLSAASDACRAYAPTHIVSLLAPPAPTPDFEGSSARLRLSFNDIVEPSEGLIPPDANHVAQLLGFLETWDRISPLLIHCWAGVSRSTASAYIAASLREGPGSEVFLARRLRLAAPFATPNSRMIGLADAQMGRDGAMIAAIAAIGRGAETDMGALFRL